MSKFYTKDFPQSSSVSIFLLFSPAKKGYGYKGVVINIRERGKRNFCLCNLFVGYVTRSFLRDEFLSINL